MPKQSVTSPLFVSFICFPTKVWPKKPKALEYTVDQDKSVKSCQFKIKRHHLRLTTHPDVASCNAAAKLIQETNQMQLDGGLRHEISIDSSHACNATAVPEQGHILKLSRRMAAIS